MNTIIIFDEMHSLHQPQINNHLKTGMKISVIIWWLTSNTLAIDVYYYEVMCQNLYMVQMLVKAHSEISYRHDHQIVYLHKTGSKLL